VIGRSAALRGALENIIDNAVKFTDRAALCSTSLLSGCARAPCALSSR